MSTNSADYQPTSEPDGPASIEDLIRQQGVPAMRTVEDLVSDDVFETDEEVDEFLEFVAEQRHANLA
jgi:hypothetical protein